MGARNRGRRESQYAAAYEIDGRFIDAPVWPWPAAGWTVVVAWVVSLVWAWARA